MLGAGRDGNEMEVVFSGFSVAVDMVAADLFAVSMYVRALRWQRGWERKRELEMSAESLRRQPITHRVATRASVGELVA